MGVLGTAGDGQHILLLQLTAAVELVADGLDYLCGTIIKSRMFTVITPHNKAHTQLCAQSWLRLVLVCRGNAVAHHTVLQFNNTVQLIIGVTDCCNIITEDHSK